jgi:endonuclease/exonuclease/phosphatase (EEP) superfamily protein YafD
MSDRVAGRTPLHNATSWTHFIGGCIRLCLLWPAVIVLVLCQIAIWLKPAAVWASVWEHFALQLTGLAVFAALIALALRRWIWAALLVALAVSAAWPLLPSITAVAAPAQAARLRVLSANLYYHAADHARTLRMLRESGADVIGLIEVTPAWRDALQGLADLYPYSSDCFATAPDCENILLSKLPLSEKRSGHLLPAAPMVVGGDVQWLGRPVTILATHVTWPLSPAAQVKQGLVFKAGEVPLLAGSLPATRQAEQAEALARVVVAMPQDLVLMGDLNGAPWSRVQRSFRAATGLDNAGWVLTWPSWLSAPLRLPLDHVLTRGNLVVTEFAAGPPTDSDHLPVIAEIGWRD